MQELKQNEEADLLHPDEESAEDTNLQHAELKKEEVCYTEILRKSTRKVQIIVAITLIAPLCNTMRFYVLELYMHALPPQASDSVIASLLFCRAMISGASSFGVAWFGDKYGHDMSLLLALSLLAAGVFIESMAHNLYVFFVGVVVSSSALVQTSLAYIAWVLPHRLAISYTSRLYTLCSVLYLLAPFLASVIVELTTYRTLFWVNAVIISLCVISVLLLIVGSQSKLHALQQSLSVAFVAQQDKDQRFPVCSVDATDTSSWKAFFGDIGGDRFVLLVIAMVSNSVSWAIETVYLFYFALFMVNRFSERHDISLLYTSGMFLCMTVSFGVCMLLVPKLIARIIPKYIYIVTLSSLCLCFLFVVSMMDLDGTMYWILSTFAGVLFGFTSISTEMCVLEMQPKQHSGKVSGAKEVMKKLFRGIAVWCTGQLWQAPLFNGMWIVNAFCALLVFAVSFGIYWFARRLK